MKKSIGNRTIALMGLLTALEVIFQVIGNFISLGPANLNLSLVPIAVGSILFGPWMGVYLGAINGLMVLVSPSTMGIFMPINVGGTILTCLGKSILCGVIPGIVFRLFKSRKLLGQIICSILTPIINTGLFVIFALIFFMPILEQNSGEFGSPFAYLILGMIGWNFIFEFVSTIIISPPLTKALNHFSKQ